MRRDSCDTPLKGVSRHVTPRTHRPASSNKRDKPGNTGVFAKTGEGRAYDAEVDSIGSYYAAIEEIGRRVKAGEEPVPTSGYFGRRRP